MKRWRPNQAGLACVIALLMACAADEDPGPDGSDSCGGALVQVQPVDPVRAERGRAWLSTQTLANGILPEAVVRNLWVAWGTLPPSNDAAYWQAFRDRYGMLEAPFDNGGLPLGVRREASGITFDCLVCHAGRVAGQTMIGLANTRIDLETFYDDLLRMRELAPMFGFPQPPVPYDLDGLTSAAGAQDAFGIGFRLFGVPGINTRFGPQQAPAWWLLARKERLYVDAAGDASGHRSTMATLVAFGVTPDQLQAREPDFEDIAHFMRATRVPCWNLSTLDPETRARGQQVFDARCAECHGRHSGEAASFPNTIVDVADVGTDPMRAMSFGPAEATALNASWFGQPPLMSTGGYLAQPLLGIWARAPYFHNGSVPDLVGVIDSTLRPTRWMRTGSELADYDAIRVGFRFTEVANPPDPNTREGRLVYDTTRPGMSNAGHTYGDSLSLQERNDLLEYLRGL